MRPRIIDGAELRANPSLVGELRANPGEFIERRFVDLADIEVEERAEDDGGSSWEVRGLAAVFGDLSDNLGGFRERIMRGAFRKVLATNPDVRALVNHDPNRPLARTTVTSGVGSLKLKEVPEGLDYRAKPTATTYAADLRANLKAGVVTQSSFAFRVAPGGEEWTEDEETGGLIRTIHEFSGLYDVSPVTYPAYPSATAGTRSEADADAHEARDAAAPEGEQNEDGQGDAFRRAAAARSLALMERISRL
jgi:HK97 family phage prohead protease